MGSSFRVFTDGTARKMSVGRPRRPRPPVGWKVPNFHLVPTDVETLAARVRSPRIVTNEKRERRAMRLVILRWTPWVPKDENLE
jgi:hypothetical protein